jgi:hypothetical protein
MAKVRILEGDDWVELYVDGKFVDSGHDFRLADLLTAIGVDNEVVYGDWKEPTLQWHTESVERNGQSIKGDELAAIAKELDGTTPQ